MFGNKIRELREKNGLILRKVAALIDVDTATLSKIELGDRQAKREHLIILADLYNTSYQELEKLWLADKIYDVIENEERGLDALNEAKTLYKRNNK
jgi:transcriptional regulator with XRE-family HTH domain